MKNTTPPDYWWDKVIRMGEAASVCAAGDSKLETIIQEHLRVWPYNEHWQITVSMNQDRWRTEVLLGAVVSFLRDRGIPLPDNLPGLPEAVKHEAEAWLTQQRPWGRATPPSPQAWGAGGAADPHTHPQDFDTPPPEKKLFTPDNRVVSTKDTPKAGAMRVLMSDLFIQLGDSNEAIWRELVRLASTEEERSVAHRFIVGIEYKKDGRDTSAMRPVIVYEEFGTVKRMGKEKFGDKLAEIRRAQKKK